MHPDVANAYGIGGEGEASKWTKYDKAVEAYRAEQKKRGAPMSTWDSDGKVYCDTLHNAKDPFSRDLNNTYELDGLDSRIKRFKKSFEDQVYRVVLSDKRFNALKYVNMYYRYKNQHGGQDDKFLGL